MIRRAALYSFLAILAAACGSEDGDDDDDMVRCDSEPRADDYAPGMVNAGADGVFDVALLEATPAPPDKGDNIWTVEIRDATSASPVSDATLTATPFMPDHGHGTPIETVVTPLAAPGQHEVDRINLWMPGLWEVRMKITTTDTDDLVVFSFCVEG